MTVEAVALASGGRNSRDMVRFALDGVRAQLDRAKAIVDLGCGIGDLGAAIRRKYEARVDGIDVVRHPDFDQSCYHSYSLVDLNAPPGIAEEQYDIVFAIEVIEHLENPRAFVRYAARLLRTGGYLVVTTVNVTSATSVATLIVQGAFREFRDGVGMYPAHITPVAPLDATRMVNEAGLELISVAFTDQGRVPYGGALIQKALPMLRGRWFSDNYRVIARRPAAI